MDEWDLGLSNDGMSLGDLYFTSFHEVENNPHCFSEFIANICGPTKGKEKAEDSTACKPWNSKGEKAQDEHKEFSSTAENGKATSNVDMVHRELSTAENDKATNDVDVTHRELSSTSQKAKIHDPNPGTEHSESSLTSKRLKLENADVDDGESSKTPENLKDEVKQAVLDELKKKKGKWEEIPAEPSPNLSDGQSLPDGHCDDHHEDMAGPSLTKVFWTKKVGRSVKTHLVWDSKVQNFFLAVQEDKKLTGLVTLYGTSCWSIVASCFPGRSGKQCRERWCNNLDPSIKRGPWTEAEDAMLTLAHNHYGNKWTSISKLIPGRTDNAVKNRYYSALKRRPRDPDENDASRDSEKAALEEDIMNVLNSQEMMSDGNQQETVSEVNPKETVNEQTQQELLNDLPRDLVEHTGQNFAGNELQVNLENFELELNSVENLFPTDQESVNNQVAGSYTESSDTESSCGN